MTTIATGEGTDVSSLANIVFEPNILYEHRIDCLALPDFVDFFTNVEGTLNQNGAELVDKRYEGNTIVYQFRQMSAENMAAKGISPLVIPAFIIYIIAGILALIAIILVLRWSLATLVGGGMDILKLALIGFGVVIIIAGAAIVLRKAKVRPEAVGGAIKGAAQWVGRGVGAAGGLASEYVKRRIIEEY